MVPRAPETHTPLSSAICMSRCVLKAAAAQCGELPRQQALRLTCAHVPDPRRHNKPLSRELAVVFVGSGPVPDKFVQAYPGRNLQTESVAGVGGLQHLSYLCEQTDLLTYPLVHVAGALGYTVRSI